MRGLWDTLMGFGEGGGNPVPGAKREKKAGGREINFLYRRTKGRSASRRSRERVILHRESTSVKHRGGHEAMLLEGTKGRSQLGKRSSLQGNSVVGLGW